MQSPATTPQAYLAALPDERSTIIMAVRDVILANLDPQYAEAMQYGMLSYVIPHSIYPAGYHCDPKQPIPFAALASQKNYLSLYLMGLYVGCAGTDESDDARWFRSAWAASGKKLDMGKACVRFKKLDDLPLDVIGEAIRRMPAQRYLALYEQTRNK
ncbi:MAG: DUF1801 domain-containing protein [Telluria sp.]